MQVFETYITKTENRSGATVGPALQLVTIDTLCSARWSVPTGDYLAFRSLNKPTALVMLLVDQFTHLGYNQLYTLGACVRTHQFLADV